MIAVRRIDHVGVCVPNLDSALQTFLRLFALEESDRGLSDAHQVEAAFLPIGDSNIELVSPRGNAGLTRFLEKRGPGLHHLALEVEGLAEVLTLLKALNVALIDEIPRIGARGHRVAFIHPSATGGVLLELVERAGS